jgi:hypothetical protein
MVLAGSKSAQSADKTPESLYNKRMSLQFSRSVRALRLDSFRASRVGLILAVANMAALIVWFFFAHVTLYEVSASVETGAEGRVVVTFPAAAMNRLRQGNAATLRLTGSADQPAISLPAYLFSRDQTNNTAEFVITGSEMLPEGTSGKLNGRIEVEVEYLTPAELVMRSSGRFFNQGQLPVSTGQPAGQE